MRRNKPWFSREERRQARLEMWEYLRSCYTLWQLISGKWRYLPAHPELTDRRSYMKHADAGYIPQYVRR